MIRGHTHVIRTVTDKLADELDSWLEGPNAVSSDYSVQHVGGRDWVIVLRHASHDAEDVAASALPQVSDSEFVDSTDAMVWAEAFCRRFHGAPVSASGGPDGLVDPGLMVGWFANAMAAAERAVEKVSASSPVRVEVYGSDHKYFQYEGGPAMPPDIAGLVEDARRTWVLWFGQDGRPKAMWLRRDTNGAVIDDPIAFSDTEPGGPGQVVQIPGWDIRMLRASR